MAGLQLFILLLLSVSIYSNQETVKVSIFYESLCPDSASFITQQLYPSYEEVAENISVDFVPYGKATHSYIDGQWKFQCQHGPAECHGNLLQTCTLSQSISQKNKCANAFDADWSAILQCSTDGTGATLLAEHGDRTHAVTPGITFIPTIIYDDVYDAELQQGSLTNFLATVHKVIGEG